MCAAVAEIASLAREAAVDAAWAQWAALGAPVSGSATASRSVIDPEALLLLSASLCASERRLDDVLAWWASAGSTLLSVQRPTSLLRQFPPSARDGVAAFAAEALKAGDGRWSSLAKGRDEAMDLAARGKRGSEPRLLEWPALMLRLRAGFGVGLKADLLAVLLAANGQAGTIQTLSQASGYTPAAVRRASQEILAADLIRTAQRRPAAHYIDARSWAAVLGTSPPEGSEWRWFAQVYAFLAWVAQWAEEQRDSSRYIAASAARDLAEAHRLAFERNRLNVSSFFRSRGEAYLDEFGNSVQAMTTWLGETL